MNEWHSPDCMSQPGLCGPSVCISHWGSVPRSPTPARLALSAPRVPGLLAVHTILPDGPIFRISVCESQEHQRLALRMCSGNPLLFKERACLNYLGGRKVAPVVQLGYTTSDIWNYACGGFWFVFHQTDWKIMGQAGVLFSFATVWRELIYPFVIED